MSEDGVQRLARRLRSKWDSLMLDRERLRRVMDSATTVVVVADRAVQHVIAQNAVERLHRAATAFADWVETSIPPVAGVAQARIRRPFTSTMLVSHV
jgi:hypothetical protein